MIPKKIMVQHYVTEEEQCSYLDNHLQTTHYQLIYNCTSQYCEDLIQRGWRRFGKIFFRPICVGCIKCDSIKIDVKKFNFSKSQKKAIRKNIDTKIIVQKPTVNSTYVDLHNKFHLYMKNKKDWNYTHHDEDMYYHSFVDGASDFAYEVLYFDQEKLIGVDLIDILPNGISSIYFFYDPDYAKLSLGVYSLLYQIKLAKMNFKDWIYLGYYIKKNDSLNYKDKYRPYITLEGRPEIDQPFIWSQKYI